MSNMTPDTEEVRLATTMTGGVSLAVWMGGVAREIDLVMQASRARRAWQNPAASAGARPWGEPSGAESQGQNLYGQLLDLLDIVVEVDVLSGTSAGGINAVLLAYARARHGDLSRLRDLWLDLGALLDLLRNPADSDVPSLLYGDRRMFKALNDKLPDLAPPEPPSKPPSTTLYVTTTLLTGESSRFTDDMGTLVQDTNQRGLFTFTEADLVTIGIEGALALAARSTASFPGAFEPSFIPFEGPTRPDGEIPARPAMRKYANITRDHWVADGGLLDNQPLDVLLERIFDRRARRPVRQAGKMVKAMLRLLSTWPPQTPATPVGIPAEWQRALQPGGDAERICRREITTTLTRRWPRGVDADGKPSQDCLPAASELFARFGRSAYDNAKSIALAVLRLAYQTATTTNDREELTECITQVHRAAGKATRPRPADLAEAACRAAVAPGGQALSLEGTAQALAKNWANQTRVDPQAWDNLGQALRKAADQLRSLAQRQHRAASSRRTWPTFGWTTRLASRPGYSTWQSPSWHCCRWEPGLTSGLSSCSSARTPAAC